MPDDSLMLSSSSETPSLTSTTTTDCRHSTTIQIAFIPSDYSVDMNSKRRQSSCSNSRLGQLQKARENKGTLASESVVVNSVTPTVSSVTLTASDNIINIVVDSHTPSVSDNVQGERETSVTVNASRKKTTAPEKNAYRT